MCFKHNWQGEMLPLRNFTTFTSPELDVLLIPILSLLCCGRNEIPKLKRTMNLKSYIPHRHKYQRLRLTKLVFIELLANFFIYR